MNTMNTSQAKKAVQSLGLIPSKYRVAGYRDGYTGAPDRRAEMPYAEGGHTEQPSDQYWDGYWHGEQAQQE